MMPKGLRHLPSFEDTIDDLPPVDAPQIGMMKILPEEEVGQHLLPLELARDGCCCTDCVINPEEER